MNIVEQTDQRLVIQESSWRAGAALVAVAVVIGVNLWIRENVWIAMRRAWKHVPCNR